MYVYIIKFEKYHNLVKIGKSIDPDTRAKGLSSYYGKILEKDFYHIGEDYTKVESHLHNHFSEYNSKDVIGDGCTEFFNDIVQNNAKTYLHKYASNSSLVFQQSIVRKKLLKEELRYKSLIALLLGYDCAKDNYTGEYSELHGGWMDCCAITTCLSLKYDLLDIATRYINREKHYSRRQRYTTPERVAAAYKLHIDGSTKYNKLKKEVASFSLPDLKIKYVEQESLPT